MPTRIGLATLLAGAAVLTAILISDVRPVSGQGQRTAIRRASDGKPDFSGVWQTLNTANWDLLAHEARRGPVIALGAAFSVPGGPGVVEGNEIPYLPAAAAKKQENAESWLTRDPEIKCYLPGVPRMIYMPYPFQIVQSSNTILMASEFASASRTIRMNSKEKSPTDTWMGWSVGHWEGDTLVIDVTDQNDQTWFDRAGDFHSDALHVVERYSPIDRNTINYEATMEDPKVFARPWKISMPLYRHVERNAHPMEYKCVEFVEELMYGHLRKQAQIATPQNPSQMSTARNFVGIGCISQEAPSPTPGRGAVATGTTFILTDMRTTPPTKYRLDGDADQLRLHVGHTLEIAGQIIAPSSARGGANASVLAAILKVQSLTYISTTCSK